MAKDKNALSLDLSEPEKAGEGTSRIYATAITGDKDGNALSGVEIQIFHNEAHDLGRHVTDDNGRVTITIENLRPGKHTITAQVVGNVRRTRRDFTIASDVAPKKKPFQVNVKKSGNNGAHVLHVSITDEEGALIKNAPFTVIDGIARRDNLTTGSTGFCEYRPVNYDPMWGCKIKIVAGETLKLTWEARLLGA